MNITFIQNNRKSYPVKYWHVCLPHNTLPSYSLVYFNNSLKGVRIPFECNIRLKWNRNVNPAFQFQTSNETLKQPCLLLFTGHLLDFVVGLRKTYRTYISTFR